MPKANTSAASVETDEQNPSRRLRLRAAWMYYVEEMTQNEIAQKLGVGRVTVVRLLAAARERNEVKITIGDRLAECVEAERLLESRFNINEAIVVPLSARGADATLPIAAATGAYVSSLVRADMRIGVGWGRTLVSALGFIEERAVDRLSIVSLLGGIIKARKFNPAEFAWRLATLFQADCYLMTAPLLVDSAATRQTLIERCGLADIFELAKSLDAVLLGAAGTGADQTSHQSKFITNADRASVVKAGAVGDMLFNFFDANGKLVDHPINQRVMSVPLEIIKKVPVRVLAAGGASKVHALAGALKLLKPTVLITDEYTAKDVLKLSGGA
ncbi:sugar-binding transcriptional regulator [Paraburkholderia humisilvae]|uniref:Erythritol catabolism regulatory protein EryD n=1 Tax=Paraburkholderia humisilvae TaxID=627669 RepID=A0A6J5E7Y5_9BURK|nr:sugar-binding transcriptional regulator [Paraburkholderia humisilvae]CAB3762629.1 Erythritol catabolism regulatory protein EryD [Paraburkholderia humisilvae]